MIPLLPTIEPLESRIAPAVFVVTNLNDTGPGSLRNAIAQADDHAGADTVIFHLPAPAAHSENIIKLQSTLTSSPVTLGDKLTIAGPGAGRLIIDGGGKVGIFDLDDEDNTRDSPMTISGLSLLHGSAPSGGAILSRESLTLKNDILSGNTSTDVGGAIFTHTTGTSLTISGCRFTANNATEAGGGIFAFNLTSISVSSTLFSGNVASGQAAAYLSLSNKGTSLTVSKSVFTGNSGDFASGLYVADNNGAANSKVTVSGCQITGNTCVTPHALGGGGLYIGPGNTTVTGTTVSGNTAFSQGGGVDIYRATSVNITKSIISGNRVNGAVDNTVGTGGGGGGGILIQSGGVEPKPVVHISSTRIVDNASHTNGGGVFAKDGATLTLTGCTVSGNVSDTGAGGVSGYGTGAAKVDMTIIGGLISGNAGATGGGVDSLGTGAVTITGAKITGNTSNDAGGGIAISGSTAPVVIKKTVVTNNFAEEYGGGLAVFRTPALTVSGGSFTGNTATYGGGIYTSDTTGSILGVTISGNIAKLEGGGVMKGTGTIASVISLQVAKVTGNSAPNGPDIFGTITLV